RNSGYPIWAGIERRSRREIDVANNVNRRSGTGENKGVHGPTTQRSAREVVPLRGGQIIRDTRRERMPDVEIGVSFVDIRICGRTRGVQVIRESVSRCNVRRMRQGIGG